MQKAGETVAQKEEEVSVQLFLKEEQVMPGAVACPSIAFLINCLQVATALAEFEVWQPSLILFASCQ